MSSLHLLPTKQERVGVVLPKVDMPGGALWGRIVPTPTFLPKACPFAGDYSILAAIGKEAQPSVNQMGENSATLQSGLPYGPEPNTILGATYHRVRFIFLH